MRFALLLIVSAAWADEKPAVPEPRLLEVIDSAAEREYANKRVHVVARRKVDNRNITEYYASISVLDRNNEWIVYKLTKADLQDFLEFRKLAMKKLGDARKPEAVSTRLVYWYSADKSVSISVNSDLSEWTVEKPFVHEIPNIVGVVEAALADLEALARTTPVLPWK